jgi:alpha-1,2-mannosyltransferase
MWVWTFTSGSGLLDGLGRPVGTDFSSFWAAGRMVLEGHAEAVYIPKLHFEEQKAIFGLAYKDYYGFYYPPTFLVISAFLGFFPYLWSLLLWQLGGLFFYVSALRQILPKNWQMGVLILGFPAVFLALGHGQNSFLTTGLFTFGLLNINRKPILAGIFFGLLAYKPQLAILLPIAIVAGGHWRTFVAAAITALLYLGLSVALFGTEVFTAYLKLGDFTRTELLELGGPGWHKLQSIFAFSRSIGAPVGFSYAMQSAVTIILAFAIWHVWRRKLNDALKSAFLAVAALLATPFVLDYDLLLLAPALAFFATYAHQTGWQKYEKITIAFIFGAPLFSRLLAEVLFIPLGLISLFAMAFIVLRRCQENKISAVTLLSA